METGCYRRAHGEGQFGNCVAGLKLIELHADLVQGDLVEWIQVGLEIRNVLGSATLPLAIMHPTDFGRRSNLS
jgi:hypothetical protein